MKTRANTSEIIAPAVIPFQKCRSVLAVAASTMSRIVEVESNTNVTKLAPQMIGRDEEVRRPIGAIVTTEDQRLDGEFQKAVLRDKEVDLVVAGVAR